MSINCLRHLNQFGQPDEPFSGSLDATSQLDEVEASFHDVIGATVTGKNVSRLSSPYGLLLPAAGEFVKRGFEGAFIYFLIRVCFLYRRQSSGRWDASMALAEFPDRLRQIETCGPLRHVHCLLGGEMEAMVQKVARALAVFNDCQRASRRLRTIARSRTSASRMYLSSRPKFNWRCPMSTQKFDDEPCFQASGRQEVIEQVEMISLSFLNDTISRSLKHNEFSVPVRRVQAHDRH